MNKHWKKVTTPNGKLKRFYNALDNREPCPAKCEYGFAYDVEEKPYGKLRTRRVCPVCKGQGRVGEVKFGMELQVGDLKG